MGWKQVMVPVLHRATLGSQLAERICKHNPLENSSREGAAGSACNLAMLARLLRSCPVSCRFATWAGLLGQLCCSLAVCFTQSNPSCATASSTESMAAYEPAEPSLQYTLGQASSPLDEPDLLCV